VVHEDARQSTGRQAGLKLGATKTLPKTALFEDYSLDKTARSGGPFHFWARRVGDS
jgi:hypothetical protein